jgi:predicted ester cyclase
MTEDGSRADYGIPGFDPGFDRLAAAPPSSESRSGGPRQREETHLNPVDSTAQTNLMLAREYLDRVFNAHRPELAAEYLTPNVKWHGGTLGTIEGPDNVVALLKGFIGGLPDLNAVEEDAVAERDLVAMRLVINATHGGPLFGVPATGNHVQWTAVDIYRMEDGQIAEEWAADDLTAILHDIGVYSPPWLS